MAEVGSDLSGIFAVHREQTARELAQSFVARYEKRFGKAVWKSRLEKPWGCCETA
jgi:hypothetical protein